MKFFKFIKSLFKKENINVDLHTETFHKLCLFAEQHTQERGQEILQVKEFQEIGRLSWKKLSGVVIVTSVEDITHKLTLQMIFTRELCHIIIRLKSIKKCDHHMNKIKKTLAEKNILKESVCNWYFPITKSIFKKILHPYDKEKEMMEKISKFIKMMDNEHSFKSF